MRFVRNVRPFLATNCAVNFTISKSKADIDGGSDINSNSGGGSFGTNGCSVTCFKISCCFCCTDELCPLGTLGKESAPLPSLKSLTLCW